MQLDTLEHVIFAQFTHDSAVQLASRLVSLLSLSKVFYSDNGSTAVEVALKMALQFWYNKGIPKTKIISFKNCYHGDTFGAMSVAGKNTFNAPFAQHLFQVDAIDVPLPGEEAASLDQLKRLVNEGNVACFIFEPLVQGVGGMIIYPPEGLNALMQYCQEHGVLTIADEVLTGFGRTGTLFASDQLKIRPNLVCLSKGLTGGFLPLGATLCTEEIFNAFLGKHLSQAFLHGHSFTANPLACQSALASLDLLLSDHCTNQRQMIETSHRAFCDKWKTHPKLARCETLGTILSLEYKTENTSYFHPLRDELIRFFLKENILLRPFGNVLYVLPPYCITEEELQTIYTAILKTL
jgi:adenosylmethionine---8-amino-7-oxononanoate aminotransferase